MFDNGASKPMRNSVLPFSPVFAWHRRHLTDLSLLLVDKVRKEDNFFSVAVILAFFMDAISWRVCLFASFAVIASKIWKNLLIFWSVDGGNRMDDASKCEWENSADFGTVAEECRWEQLAMEDTLREVGFDKVDIEGFMEEVEGFVGLWSMMAESDPCFTKAVDETATHRLYFIAAYVYVEAKRDGTVPSFLVFMKVDKAKKLRELKGALEFYQPMDDHVLDFFNDVVVSMRDAYILNVQFRIHDVRSLLALKNRTNLPFVSVDGETLLLHVISSITGSASACGVSCYDAFVDFSYESFLRTKMCSFLRHPCIDLSDKDIDLVRKVILYPDYSVFCSHRNDFVAGCEGLDGIAGCKRDRVVNAIQYMQESMRSVPECLRMVNFDMREDDVSDCGLKRPFEEVLTQYSDDSVDGCSDVAEEKSVTKVDGEKSWMTKKRTPGEDDPTKTCCGLAADYM